ncbi:MAG: ribonuclease P protein component [Alphaproteobacteria bacterium]|nr:ribonuclease P protein component [Alphaproteobacteria bacterium]
MSAKKIPLIVLRKRAEFLAVAQTGRKWVAPGLILQMGVPAASGQLRYGLTASRKIGNAVTRNRARRRLRALAQEVLPPHAAPNDYVLIARATSPSRDFDALRKDLMISLQKLGAWRDAA